MPATMGQGGQRKPAPGAVAAGLQQQQQAGVLEYLADLWNNIDGLLDGTGVSSEVARNNPDLVYQLLNGSTFEKQSALSRLAKLSGGGGGGGGSRGGGGGGGGGGGMSSAQKAAQYAAEAQNIAGTFGLEGDWAGLGATAAANNWSIEMLRDHIADQITMDTANRAGLVKQVFDSTRALGGDYFVNFSDEDLLGYAKRVAKQELDTEAIKADVVGRAKSRYYWLEPQLTQGQTMRQIFAPQRETIAQLLEMSPEQVDFVNDGRFQKVVEATALDGSRYSLNVTDTARHVRRMDEWRSTNNAKNQVGAAVTALAKMLGGMG